MNIAELFVRLSADTSGLKKGMKDGASSMDALKSAAAKLGIALSAGALFRSIIRNSIESQNAMAQLGAAVKSTGGAAGRSVAELDALSSALERQTTFSDEAIKGAEGLLLTFTKIKGDTFDQATAAVLDLAQAMGGGEGGLKSASIQVGKALNDPILGMTALRKVGVSFSESQQDVIKNLQKTGDLAGAQALILKELETEFGGSAAAARDTLGGALKALENAWGNQLEVSRQASSGIVDAINAIADALPLLRSGVDFVVKGWASLGIHAALAVEQMELVARALDPRRIWNAEAQAAFEQQKRTVQQFADAAADMMVELENGAPPVADSMKKVAVAVEEVGTSIDALGGTFKADELFDAIAASMKRVEEIRFDRAFERDGKAAAKMDADLAELNKSIADMQASLLTAGISQKFEDISIAVQDVGLKAGALTALQRALKNADTAVLQVRGSMATLNDQMARTVTSGIDAFAAFAVGAGGSLKDFVKGAIQDLARLIAKLAIVGALKAAFAGATGGFGGFLLAALSPRASGGPVRAGGSYMVGERGPEMFVPSSSGTIVPSGGGAAALLAGLPPIPRPMSPNEAALHVWYREAFKLLAKDNAERG